MDSIGRNGGSMDKKEKRRLAQRMVRGLEANTPRAKAARTILARLLLKPKGA